MGFSCEFEPFGLHSKYLLSIKLIKYFMSHFNVHHEFGNFHFSFLPQNLAIFHDFNAKSYFLGVKSNVVTLKYFSWIYHDI